MATYTPNPVDSTNPPDSGVPASTASAEFRAIKSFLNVLSKCIMIYTGATTAIPAGWHICDGTSGTVDLRDKFIVGAGHNYAVGATGGEAAHTLTANEMPSHNHGISDPGHNHNNGGYTRLLRAPYPGSLTGSDSTGSGSEQAVGAGDSADIVGSGTGITIQANGGGAAHNNLPPYYAFAFIQYIGQ